MVANDPAGTGRQPSPAGNSEPTVIRDEDEIVPKHQGAIGHLIISRNTNQVHATRRSEVSLPIQFVLSAAVNPIRIRQVNRPNTPRHE
jgi:hypothetical protein